MAAASIVRRTTSRVPTTKVTASTEGAPLPRIYGRARVGGQIIWATDLEEEIVTTTQAAGSGKGSSGNKTRLAQYNYYANFAVALGEGVVTRIGRVWADEQEIDLARTTFRLHTGTETQDVDSLIAAREGVDNAPSYRGVAYVVFEHFALADYGNRVPQLSFEIFRSVSAADQDSRACRSKSIRRTSSSAAAHPAGPSSDSSPSSRRRPGSSQAAT